MDCKVEKSSLTNLLNPRRQIFPIFPTDPPWTSHFKFCINPPVWNWHRPPAFQDFFQTENTWELLHIFSTVYTCLQSIVLVLISPKLFQILDFYDNHDIWHFLSSAGGYLPNIWTMIFHLFSVNDIVPGLFCCFMLLLTLDEGLAEVTKNVNLL